MSVRAGIGGTKPNAGPQRRIDWAAKLVIFSEVSLFF